MWEKGPYIVYWNITTVCNMKCVHCHASSSISKELPTPDIVNIIDKLKINGVGMIIIAGGEPLLRKDIWYIINYIKKCNIRVSIVTNGYYLTPFIAEKIKRSGITEVQISLDAGIQELHDSFRGCKGSFEKAFNAIDYCKKVSIPVSVNTVLTNMNIDTLNVLGDLLEKKCVKTWRITITVPKGRGKDNYKLLDINRNNFSERLMGLKEKYKNVVFDDPLVVCMWKLDNKIAKQCGAAKLVCAIESNGDIKPCVFYDSIVGNILENTLESIWTGSEMSRIRDNEPKYKECLECQEYKYCKGGCKVMNLYQPEYAKCIFNRVD